MSEQAKDDAARTLIHYFRVLFKKTGLKWDADCEAEIRGIVYDIVQAAVEP